MTADTEDLPTATVEDLKVIVDKLNHDSSILNKDDSNTLKEVLENPTLGHLLNIQNCLSAISKDCTKIDHIRLCLQIIEELKNKVEDEKCKELRNIIVSPHFRCFIEAYENIVFETYKETDVFLPKQTESGPPMRMVGLAMNSSEEFGVTLGKYPDGCIYVQQILRGSIVEKQALIHVGDIIKEINGQPVGNEPEEVQALLRMVE